MAASTTAINGTDYVLEISTDSGTSWDTVAHLTSASLSFGAETRDITTKDSSGWRELAGGLKSWSMSAEGYVRFDTVADKVKFNDLFGYQSNRTMIDARITNANAGDYEYSGNVLITSLETETPMEDTVSFSMSMEGSGALTQAIIT